MFSVQVGTAAGTAVLQLRGELDVESVVQLDEAGEIAVRSTSALVVVDCAALSFCDSSGCIRVCRPTEGGCGWRRWPRSSRSPGWTW
ncbi:STAS domain-containing protein [Streptomyces sp. NPDC058653]|uniref:STAS domain-containing protein n=1 Tax=Streptomyces sp. NPDC058653 TaxID=3346576 RepID=UPI003656FC1E